METKISTLENKNYDQTLSLKRLHDQLEEERSLSKTHKRQLDETNIAKYEFEIKLRQATQENGELEDSH